MTSKIFRLSPTDVANTAPLSTEKKELILSSIQVPKVFWGYSPVYRAFPKILMVGSGLFGTLPRDSDESILAQIKRQCRRTDQEKANLAVAQSIIDWREQTNARGVLVSPEPYRTTSGDIQFCADVAVVIDGRLFVVNLDVRSQMNLQKQGKAFMKSVIHHTALIGDLKEANVGILRTPKIKGGQRRCELEELDGDPQFTLDEVERMILETYSIWELILMKRRSEASRPAANGDVPLFS